MLVGAGEIASCGRSDDTRTADLIAKSGGIPFTTGDNAYSSGTATEYAKCYVPTWGRFKAQTRPVVGDNEYLTPGAKPYFDYFGAAAGDRRQGWYSYDVGAWHVVVLNSNCSEVGGCDTGSAQERWLRADLAASRAHCLAAMWHEPRFSSTYGNNSSTRAFWNALYDYGADVVLNGHHHVYERFAPQDPDGHADPNGIRQFVIGTGGMGLSVAFRTVQPNSAVRNNRTHGVLKLTLHPHGYDFAFLPVEGSFEDSGSGGCGRATGGGEPAPDPGGAITVAPTADARVESKHDGTNAGRSSSLVVDGSPVKASYLRFDVVDVGPVSKATLRLFVKDKSSNGPEVFPTVPGWSEHSVSWDSRPARTGPSVADAGRVSAGRWVDYDVSSVVTGDGRWSFELTGSSSDATIFKSRESSSNRPQLVLVPAPPPPPPPPEPERQSEPQPEQPEPQPEPQPVPDLEPTQEL